MPQHVHRLSNLDTEARTADCAACGPVSVWRKKARKPGSFQYGCRGKKRQDDRGHRLSQLYNLTPAEWHAMLVAQSGLCLICTEQTRNPYTDHDHQTGRVRGLLCKDCNFGIGQFRDDVKRLRAAAAYLEAHQAV